jgi:MFS family permease
MGAGQAGHQVIDTNGQATSQHRPTYLYIGDVLRTKRRAADDIRQLPLILRGVFVKPSRMAVPRLSLAAYLGLSKTKERRTFSWRALRNRSFRYYFAGSATSDFGTWLQNTAQVILAYRLSHSVLVVGLVTCAQFSSPLVLGPWAGVMTDKFGGRRILFASQIAAALVAGLMAALAFTGHMQTLWLGCGAIASGLAFTFALPARNVTVRRLVPAADIRPAFAMDSVSYNLGRSVAPPVSVLLTAMLGFGWAFAANALSFLIFAVCLMLAGHGQPVERREKSHLKDGFDIARYDWRIAVLLLMVAAVTVADDPVLVLGSAVAEHLHASPGWSGWFIAALGAGTVLGSLHPSKHQASLRLAATALAILGASMMLFVLSPWLPATVFAAFGAGMMCLVANSATRTLLATRAGPAHEASVMAVWAIAWAGSKPVASLGDGFLAGWIGIKWTGVLLALPAMLPIVVLFALSVLVFVVQKWKPRQSRLSSRRERLTSQEWFRRTEELIFIPPPAESVVKTHINV